jgi:hypothetical protein
MIQWWLEAAMLAEREAPSRKMDRVKCLSIDMPASLHRRFKVACTAADKVVAEEVLALIERRTAELEKGLHKIRCAPVGALTRQGVDMFGRR